MKTVNTVVANLERVIMFSDDKEESNIYQYRKIGRELCFGKKLIKYGTNFIDYIVKGMQKKGMYKMHIGDVNCFECSDSMKHTRIGRGLVRYYLKSAGQSTS